MTLAWTIGAWVLGVLGGGLLLWTLFWDRARGRSRCRRCWYDLSESGGPPVRCPECGKHHRTVRATRRTRRRWGWAVLAALLIVSSWHGFERRREVASRGWMAGVPLPLLVLPTAWMSEKPGSVWRGDVNEASGFEFAVAEELAARGTRYGRVARAMLVGIGKRSSPEVITDRTTMKGAVFRSVFGRLYGERVLSPAQGRWARSVVWAGFDTRDAWHPDAAVHGVLRTRSLVGGPYVAGVLSAPGKFEAFHDTSHFRAAAPGAPAWAGRAAQGTVTGAARDRLLEQWRWDTTQIVRDEFWGGWSDGVVAMIDDMFLPDGSRRWYTVWFESEDANDPYLGSAARFAEATVPATVVFDESGGPAIHTDAATGAGLERTLRALLTPVSMGFWGGDWRPVVALEWAEAGEGEPITFGGRTAIVLRRDGESDTVLMSGEGCWFRADPSAGTRLTARSRGRGMAGSWSGALVTDASKAIPTPIPGDRLVARFEPEQFEGRRSVFADLEADRVYLGVVEVELVGWTLEEINRLRVSGVWPDHAMRE